ncbi:hypothetical protein [Streptomyces iconiensis]|uniref:Uncharacterized protein n=1 Tax=Streptomyces iconiensis TaxID=1384038 RepID=A0ABT7A1L2_9ACTN|nr:hypothetical protein [Streptomyces iconiensis]MDJ1134503.1 hypothetical protein [Streptomyces iconiensis]
MKIYPYPRLRAATTITIDSASVTAPGVPREPLAASARSVIDRVLGLGTAETQGWDAAVIKVSATVPESALRHDAPWSDLAVFALLTEGATNTRLTARLAPTADDPCHWTGQLGLARADIFDRARLSAQVVATVDGVPGRLVGESEDDWFIDVTADVPVRDRPFETVRHSFAEGPYWLRRMKDVPWVVDPAGKLPTVHINTDVEGIEALLDADGRGMEGAVGELLAAQMASDIWLAVFHAALGDLELDERERPMFPSGWRGAVLREMLPDILPEQSLETALRALNERRVGATGWTDIQPRIHYAAARRGGTGSPLIQAVRGLERLRREDDE